MRIKLAFFAALLVAGVAATIILVRRHNEETRVRDLVSFVLAHPDHFRVFRITNQAALGEAGPPERFEQLLRHGPHIGPYPILYGAEVLDRAVMENAASLLRDPRHYPPPARPDDANTCVPNPGVAFQFTRGAQHVEVVMCFRCVELWIYPTGWGYFSPIRPALAAVVHKALPNEPAFDLPVDVNEQRSWDPSLR